MHSAMYAVEFLELKTLSILNVFLGRLPQSLIRRMR